MAAVWERPAAEVAEFLDERVGEQELTVANGEFEGGEQLDYATWKRRYTEAMARKASVVIEKDEHGFYAWCPELKGCQSQGNTLEETLANIKEAIELYLETLPPDERDVLLSQEILTTAVEVNA